jgi:hypothetical protein
MATTSENFNEQLTELETKALSFITDAQAPVAEYVGKVAEAVAARLPEDRPQLLAQGIDALISQVDFAKKALDAQVDFAKAVLDAAVKPVRPVVTKPKTVKAA